MHIVTCCAALCPLPLLAQRLTAGAVAAELLTDEEIDRRNPEFADPTTRIILSSGWLAPYYIWAVHTNLGARLSFLTVQAVVYKLYDMWAKVRHALVTFFNNLGSCESPEEVLLASPAYLPG